MLGPLSLIDHSLVQIKRPLDGLSARSSPDGGAPYESKTLLQWIDQALRITAAIYWTPKAVA